MSTPINGVIDREWRKHLRPWGKKSFWKRHRKVSRARDDIGRNRSLEEYETGNYRGVERDIRLDPR